MKRWIIAIVACIAAIEAGMGIAFRLQAPVAENRAAFGNKPDMSLPYQPVVYSHVHGDLGMDIYLPKGNYKTAAVLLLHGGGWVSGAKIDMEQLALHIAQHGMVAASADYRLAPKNRWPAQLEDVQTAVRYLRANAERLHIDPNRIGAIGISAGGHLSMFLGAVDPKKTEEYPEFSSRVQAVGSISGLHDLRLKMTAEGETYGIVEKLTGAREGPAVDAASPILSLTKRSAPTYFIQGADDPLVPPNQTAEAAKRLSELGVPEKSETVPGMQHGITISNQAQAAAFNRMLNWIDSQMDIHKSKQ